MIVADDAFPKKTYIMKPFSFKSQNMNQRIFNYRLSRARRIIENVFGICAARFRILRRPIELHPNRVTKIVMCICALHNFLVTKSSCYSSAADFDQEINGQLVEGRWRRETESSERGTQPRNRNTNEATEVQNVFMNYFISNEGEVPWQYTSCGY